MIRLYLLIIRKKVNNDYIQWLRCVSWENREQTISGVERFYTSHSHVVGSQNNILVVTFTDNINNFVERDKSSFWSGCNEFTLSVGCNDLALGVVMIILFYKIK